MFVDYLEDEAEKLRKMSEKLHELSQQYRDFFDPQLREEMHVIKKKIRREQFIIRDEAFSNILELRLLKKYFPNFFEELKNDEFIGKTLSRMEWLLDFKELKNASKEFEKIKKSRKELKEAKKFVSKWVGKMDHSSIEATWKVLKGNIEDEMVKDDVLEIIDNLDLELKRKGWLVLMNEPLVYGRVSKFIEKIKISREDEFSKKHSLHQVQGLGTKNEYKAEKEYREAVKRKKYSDKRLEHFLQSNPSFLANIKKNKTTWRDKVTSNFMKNFSKKVSVKRLNEQVWVKEMKEKLKL